MPASGQTTKEPTEDGARILKLIRARGWSIARAAREAGVHEITLRRRIYDKKPARLELGTVEKLESVGIPRSLLNLSRD